MKSFAQFLTESKKTYKFKVRIAGDLPENCEDMIETALQKYELVNMSAGKKTPIVERPLDFPQLQNTEVTTYEVEVSYPTTGHVLERYLSETCKINHSYIIVRGDGEPQEEYQETGNNEPYEALLNTEDMGGESAQNNVGANRVMDLLKELEIARKEREIDPINAAPKGESKDIGDADNAKSPLGSK